MISSLPSLCEDLIDSSSPPFAPKALRSNYGASDRQKKNNTVKAHACPGARPQEIYTPQCIKEAVYRVWDHVALDPCWGPGSIMDADTHYYVPPRIEVRMVKNAKTKKFEEKSYVVFKAAPGDTDGLVLPWADFTFVNPPYAHLDEWLPKAMVEAALGFEVMVLCPVRPHRKWWRAAEKASQAVCYLDPLKFLGNKSAIPLPMCVMYFGQRPAIFKAVFESAGLGECL